MKKLLLLLTLAFSISVNAQDDKTVTLTVSGQGKTQDEAKQNALRSAIEQAFGAFISSKTEILNDNLVKDEIVSVTNGNIQKFEPISEVQLPDGNYASTLKATVSVSKLTTFCEGKGVAIEFKGSLFAFNINQQKINETNEEIAIRDIIKVTSEILKKSFIGTIKAGNPIFINDDNYRLPLEIDIKVNENIILAVNYFYKNIKNLNMPKAEIENYDKIKKPVFDLYLSSSDNAINGQLDYFLVQTYSCNGKPNCKGWRDKKINLYEYFSYEKQRNFSLGIKPDFNYKNYSVEKITLRNKISKTVIMDFIGKIKNIATDFYISNQENIELKYSTILTLGSLPISSLQQQMSYCANYQIWNYNALEPIYAKFYKYQKANRLNIEETFIIHRFEKDGLVLKIIGNSDLKLNDIKKISNIKLQYNNK